MSLSMRLFQSGECDSSFSNVSSPRIETRKFKFSLLGMELMMSSATQSSQKPVLAEEDKLRADFYDYLAVLLSSPPSNALLEQTGALVGDKTDFGQRIRALARIATLTDAEAVKGEFNALFIGLGRGELLPYASFYLTGFLHERPLLFLREDMATLGISRAPSVFEPEDNVASLCEMMAGLIMGRFESPASLAGQKAFFAKHMAPWMGYFFTDLESAENAVFYASVGALGRGFMGIEREAFRMTVG